MCGGILDPWPGDLEMILPSLFYDEKPKVQEAVRQLPDGRETWVSGSSFSSCSPWLVSILHLPVSWAVSSFPEPWTAGVFLYHELRNLYSLSPFFFCLILRGGSAGNQTRILGTTNPVSNLS